MRPVLEFILALSLIVALAFLISKGTMESAVQRQELQEKIESLLGQDEVTLTDLVAELGQPDELTTATCEGAQCLKAIWDLSLPTWACWRRLIVVLNERQRTVFFSEMKEIIPVGDSKDRLRCIEAPN